MIMEPNRSDKGNNGLKRVVPALLVLASLSLLWFFIHLSDDSAPISSLPHFLSPAHVQNDLQWSAPDTNDITNDEKGRLIRYGRLLITQTSLYIGPFGKILKTGNGLNCQNCHLEAGTKLFGNNYSAVAANYPKFRDRSGSVESVFKRVNDCFRRSLHADPLDSTSLEMKAIKAYILWLGKDVAKNQAPYGCGLPELGLLKRAADPEKGKSVFSEFCTNCHGENGSGKWNDTIKRYTYPPLWGSKAYTVGAGMYRISKLASFIHKNMPKGVDANNPRLTEEQAWDVAAYIESQEHPDFDLSGDWPTLSKKPIDHPFGPYADNFSEKEHKYGPFGPIKEFYKKQHDQKNH